MNKKKTLPTLITEMSSILAAIAENEGELTPDLEAAFDNVGTDLAVKVDRYSFFMERLDNEADFWRAKAEKYSRVSKSCKLLKERLNGSIKSAMQMLNTDEVAGNDARFKLSKMAPKLVVDETRLDASYTMVVTTHVPDKERIKHDIAAGIKIEGAQMEEVFSLRKYPARKV